eukprot:TRINITY_DN8646_c0_g2_i4.p1 TRINITY_DN8646_c0_g2~~TRINITY_DN8646_c0_g2_i4.p1  ORF type:complete len:752 (-),score=157.65 TRINITY_DN8646_c0_g2_i4:111-2366(-)
MDAIDTHQNIVVRSPPSSGKTMLALYLAQKMKDVGKVTLYLAPNKPVCNEFSLFVYNQGLEFAIGTEDYFNWEDMLKADVMICTPTIMTRMWFFPQEPFIHKIGGIIFDELPRMMHSHEDHIPILFFLSSVKKWQTMILSATLSDDHITLFKSFFQFQLLEPGDTIRPTDLVVEERRGVTFRPVYISDLYSNSLLSSSDCLSRALRIPVTLEEFEVLFKKSRKGPTYEIAKRSLPKTHCITGHNMTRFVTEVKKAEELITSGKVGDHDRVDKKTHLGVEISRLPSLEEIYDIITGLTNQGMIPALFFHTNTDELDRIHRELTSKLEKEFSEKSVPRLVKKALKRTNNNKPDEKVWEESIQPSTPVNPYGGLGDEELCEIFKHHADHSGAEGKIKYRFGYRGRKVLHSHYYPGLRLGLGIHHHAVEPPVRDAVESGLRLEYLRLVFCDTSLAMGLNMPVRSIVFLGDAGLSPEEFVQASGRAGRWGRDSVGHVHFSGHTNKEIEKIWAPFSPPPARDFPISLSMLLSFCAGETSNRKLLSDWFQCSVDKWNWVEGRIESELNARLLLLRDLGLIRKNADPTLAGLVAISMEEGPVSIFLGHTFAHFREELNQSIKSPRDFLFFISHFLKAWRVDFRIDLEGRKKRSRPPGPTLVHESVVISVEMRDLMKRTIEYLSSALPRGYEGYINHTQNTTALYVLYPDCHLFERVGWHSCELDSFVAHFLQKVRLFQSLARLPFGDLVLQALSSELSK